LLHWNLAWPRKMMRTSCYLGFAAGSRGTVLGDSGDVGLLVLGFGAEEGMRRRTL
jgi:hypothetical protein